MGIGISELITILVVDGLCIWLIVWIIRKIFIGWKTWNESRRAGFVIGVVIGIIYGLSKCNGDISWGLGSGLGTGSILGLALGGIVGGFQKKKVDHAVDQDQSQTPISEKPIRSENSVDLKTTMN